MSEADAIERTDEPVTPERIADDLSALGIEAGDVLIVHSSLSQLGWVPGGPPAVVDALQEVLTEKGTLVMPTHSTQYTDPSWWENPPLPDSWLVPVRESMPAFRPEVTPTRGMGAIPECFRTYPGVRRSRHPAYSFAAWGAHRDEVIEGHTYEDGLGENSPLARVYDLDGDVLLLGVGHDSNTSLHFAEYLADWGGGRSESGSPVLVDGARRWITYEELDVDSGDFADLGADFEEEHEVVRGQVGATEARLIPQRELVDFGVEWLEANR